MAAYKTEQRSLLMEFLRQNPDRQFSAREIAGRLPALAISLSAVYRNLSALEAAGLIARFTREGSREIYYQYTQAEECRNCIHMICTKCGKTFHVASKIADRLQTDVRLSAGFQVDRSKTILYGLCRDCRGK
jgi:Fur family ferric uptake transcriptional regulator